MKSAFAVDSNFADSVCAIFQTTSGFLIAVILSTMSGVFAICQTVSGFFPPSLQDSTGKMSVGPATKVAVPQGPKAAHD